jgi:PAS domain S-box-containing protein
MLLSLGCLYYYSRVKKKYYLAIIAVASLTYIAIVINYNINSGINGPTIFLFLLTFNLLIASTPNRMHGLWLLLHLVIGTSLITADLGHAGLVKYGYHNEQERFVDVWITCLLSLLFIYIITKYLRNYYLRAKLKAEESQVRLKAFFESTDSCYILLNTKMQIIYFNGASAKFIYGAYKKYLHEGDNVETFVSYSYIHRFRENYYNALNGVKNTEERMLQYDNCGKIWWQFSFAPVFNMEGDISGVSFSCVNITLRMEQAEKIKERNKSLTKIAFLQSHELRQPVSSILGLINLIKEDAVQSPEYIQYLQDAVAELDTKLHVIIAQTNDVSAKGA